MKYSIAEIKEFLESKKQKCSVKRERGLGTVLTCGKLRVFLAKLQFQILVDVSVKARVSTVYFVSRGSEKKWEQTLCRILRRAEAANKKTEKLPRRKIRFSKKAEK
jgi:hypothetical protein